MRIFAQFINDSTVLTVSYAFTLRIRYTGTTGAVVSRSALVCHVSLTRLQAVVPRGTRHAGPDV